MAARLDNGEDGLEDVNTFVVVIPRNTGYMKVTYLMVDHHTRSILPKASIIKWPRLTDFIDFRACVLKNILYITGGREKSSGKCVRQTLRYDPFVGRWRDCADMKVARANHTATAFNGRLFAIGGETSSGEILESCEYYEPLVDEWQKTDPLLGGRKHHACIAKDDKLYLCGGTSRTEHINDNIWVLKRLWLSDYKQGCYVYNWHNFNDEQQTAMSQRLARHNLQLVRGKLHFLAGIRRNLRAELGPSTQELSTKKTKKSLFMTSKSIEAYKVPSKTTNENPVLHSKVTSSTEKVQGWAIGNDFQNLNLKETAAVKKRWIHSLGESKHSRCAAGSVVIGNKIYLIGGHRIEEDSKSQKIVEYFHAKHRKWFEGFSLGDGDFRNVDCITFNVPVTNTDFKPVRYGDCRWVLW